MNRIIIAIVAVLSITQSSLQAFPPNDEPLNYSITNLSPDDGQNIDPVSISDSNKPNSENTTFPISVLNSPRIDASSWPNYVMRNINLTTSYRYIDNTLCLFRPFFCCRFKLSFQKQTAGVNSQHYYYRFGVFQGLSLVVTTPPTLCSVFRCASDDLKDCDKDITINTDVVFYNITIIANTTKEHDYVLKRSSFRADMSPFPESNYEWHEYEENDYYGVHYVLNTTAANLYSFSIDATAKNTDGGDDGAAALTVSIFIVLSIFLSNILL